MPFLSQIINRFNILFHSLKNKMIFRHASKASIELRRNRRFTPSPAPLSVMALIGFVSAEDIRHYHSDIGKNIEIDHNFNKHVAKNRL
jgi:hypothetical protein